MISRLFRPALWTLLAAGCLSSAMAQPATAAQRAGVVNPNGFGTMHLQASLGSFRLIDGEGRFEVSFRGTLLLSKFEGKATIGPGVVEEYRDKESGRVAYHGKGKVVLVGKWRVIQWFGGDMNATWFGRGLARITGEFDRNLNTGTYWYDDPSKKFYWFANSANTVTNPQMEYGRVSGATPKRRRHTP